jgi:hypothetical protein
VHYFCSHYSHKKHTEKYRKVIINAAKNVLLSNNSVVRHFDGTVVEIKIITLEKLTNCVYFH